MANSIDFSVANSTVEILEITFLFSIPGLKSYCTILNPRFVRCLSLGE